MEGHKPNAFPAQTQDVQPALEKEMNPKPEYIRPGYKGSGKLEGKVALVTGGDSGIGRSIAVHFAREGADVAISYMDHEQKDADETKQLIEKEGRKCLLLPGDLRNKEYCNSIVEKTMKELGKLNVLVNNAAIQFLKPGGLEEVDDEQLEKVFDVNILSFFRVTRAALKHLKEGDAIINTTSRTAYEGSGDKIDYSSTKGAIIAFTRSLAGQLTDKKIRVNAVSPGLVWTPLIVATMKPEEVKTFGTDVPMKRAGQPSECGPAYVFLACEDSSYFTGQCLHPNGGMILNT